MNIEEYREYCLAKKEVTESFPFGKLSTVLVFKVLGKMFSATDINNFDSITIKCDPNQIDHLRETYDGVSIAPYMHKRHWNSVAMDNSIPDKLLKQWIDDSYELVVKKLPSKDRAKLLMD